MAAELLLIAGALLLLAGLTSWVFSRPTPVADAHQATLASAVGRHARRRATIAGVGAILVGATLLLVGPPLAKTVAGVVGPEGPTGLSFALTPLAIGLVFTVTFLLAERTWPRPTEPVRSAPLRRRSVSDFSPRWLLALTAIWVGGLVVLLVWTGIVATGNMLTVGYQDAGSRGADASFGWVSAGPFPGWGYGIPTLVVAGLLLTTAWLTLREIRRRPAMPGLDAAADDAFRRSSARQVLGVTQATLSLTLSGNLFFVSSVLRSVSQVPAAVVFLALSVAVGIIALVGLGLAARRR
ncbi:MAG TPA: hypothetical protein PKE40_04430 [Arachnia sp.]|nr:hypothetical protein [Arachnia sp.]HMT85579.1 hypothetical protein [Arachnia sp.]